MSHVDTIWFVYVIVLFVSGSPSYVITALMIFVWIFWHLELAVWDIMLLRWLHSAMAFFSLSPWYQEKSRKCCLLSFIKMNNPSFTKWARSLKCIHWFCSCILLLLSLSHECTIAQISKRYLLLWLSRIIFWTLFWEPSLKILLWDLESSLLSSVHNVILQ